MKDNEMKKTISLILLLAFGLVAEVANADFTFGTPINLGPIVNSSSGDAVPSILPDGLTLLFESDRSGGSGGCDIWVTTRTKMNDEWASPVNLGSMVNSSYYDGEPSISGDGLSLLFVSNRPGGSGDYDLWFTMRASVSEPWGEPANLGTTVNSSTEDATPAISADGMSLFFHSMRSGGYGEVDLWMTMRATVNDPWEEPVNLGPTVNSEYVDATPGISTDMRTLFFASIRPGGYGYSDIWVTTRPTISDPWGAPVNLGPTVNSTYREGGPNISADGSTLYFNSKRPGGSGYWDLWQVSIEPVVDLDGNEKVDFRDFATLASYWGRHEPSVDIAPLPFGGGEVDMRDLYTLMTHWLEDNSLQLSNKQIYE